MQQTVACLARELDAIDAIGAVDGPDTSSSSCLRSRLCARPGLKCEISGAVAFREQRDERSGNEVLVFLASTRGSGRQDFSGYSQAFVQRHAIDDIMEAGIE
jgi:hypothetical protein